jgi:transcriptional regulator with XRE-family HTH domain
VCQAIRPPAVAALKSTREALGLSLADIKSSTEIEKSNLSRLENDPLANPTIDTLCRYAEAVGKEMVITLVDISKKMYDEVLSGRVPNGSAVGKLSLLSCHGRPLVQQQYLTAHLYRTLSHHSFQTVPKGAECER